MANEDTQRLISMVEEHTGYRVMVGTSDIETADAQMISAKADPPPPIHIINVSKHSLSRADYIVAMQCVMLLNMWSHPKGVPQFCLHDDRVKKAIDETANWSGLAGLPKHVAIATAQSLVQGLLHQLCSTPSELLAVDYCLKECPTLREQQATSLHASFRRNTQSMKPELRDFIPPDIFAANMAMCASVAILWGKRTGDTVASLPYKAIGADTKAGLLLDVFDLTSGSPAERSMATVDAWAKIFKLSDLYTWTFRPK